MTTIHTRTQRPRRIVFATLGSSGDLNPYLALGAELIRRGHRADIATSPVYRPRIEAAGLGFHALGPDFDALVSAPGLVDRVLDQRKGSEALIREVVMPALPRAVAELGGAVEGADLLVSHPLTFAARLVAETRGVRWASTFLAPFTAFSAMDPPAMAEVPFLRALSAFGPRAVRAMQRLVIRRARSWSEPWTQLRADLGLGDAPDPLFGDQHSPDLALGLFSPLFASPQADWPKSARVTGFPFAAESDTPPLAAPLEAFLAAGPPPLVFTLGTAMIRRPGAFFEESLRIVRRLGRRAVFVVGNEGVVPPGHLTDDVLAVAQAPFSRLFPRAAAIVHHSGIGTTAEAMRAGRPFLAVPFAYDQPDNAARAARLGIALTLPIGRYGESGASARLRALLDQPRFATRARAMGERIRAEEGTRAACDALLDLIERG